MTRLVLDITTAEKMGFIKCEHLPYCISFSITDTGIQAGAAFGGIVDGATVITIPMTDGHEIA